MWCHAPGHQLAGADLLGFGVQVRAEALAQFPTLGLSRNTPEVTCLSPPPEVSRMEGAPSSAQTVAHLLIEVRRHARRQAAAGHDDRRRSRRAAQVQLAFGLFGEGELRSGKHEPVLTVRC